MIPIELRRRIVEAYTRGRSGTYDATAELFGVGRATVNRLLRRQRETGSVEAKAVGGNYPRRIDLDWLRQHAEKCPDARLSDRIEAWERVSGRRVASSSMSKAMKKIGWTHKKNASRLRSRASRRSG